MKTVVLISIVSFLIALTACRKGPINRNLNHWEGTWDIEKVAVDTGNAGFLDNGWKRSKTLVENYGTLSIDENAEGILHIKNSDFSAADSSVTMHFYMEDAGKAHLRLVGLTVTASSNADLPLGKQTGNDGELTFWIRHSMGKERVLQVDYLNTYCNFNPTTVGDGAYYWFLKKSN